ncbi:GNAT family N-acetyltransferase [Clostridium sp.]|uniref:GNAT family N-acetyltransferase n=1 Tax=Clostridium sp. TaxID=1506 RepID=UPI0026388DD1|nr:GNAT family N-acetyltransferase [Clostridium sp.]
MEQLDNKKQNLYVLWNNNSVVGSVSCYGNEIDDLIVNKSYQNNGLGKQLLLWAIKHIRKNNYNPIILHVAKWNEKALNLYLDNGFKISKTEKIR